jgi:fatty-acyl-CoA synthase
MLDDTGRTPLLDALSYEALTPTAHLVRAAHVHGDRLAVVDGDVRLTYAELHDRAQRLAGGLAELGVAPGDRVAVLAPNSLPLLEAHYGIPYAGAVIVALNIRLSVAELGYILEHSGASVLVCDAAFTDLGREAVAASGGPAIRILEAGGPASEYDELIAGGKPLMRPVTDERSLLALNYTSGTTGRPKGVMYHHRGAYLQSLAMVVHPGLRGDSVFLWTLPMFHCNGWCFTWAVTAAGATHVCQRRIEPGEIWQAIREHGVTHLCAAPTVLASLAYDPLAAPLDGREPVWVGTGGAPPAPALLARMAELGLTVTHLYGLTETFGPIMLCDWRRDWDELPAADQARLKARQGVANVVSQAPRVVDADGEVAADARSMGEVVVRGNTVMLGYYRDPDATSAAAGDGWFHTGDLGVVHPDGYVELRDRAKDIIVSGGENIASVEIEQVLVSHPAVLEAAVIPAPDEKWGERPIAYVTLRPGLEVSERDLRAFARTVLPGFKVPDRIRFGDLPKTATGKVRKYALREEAWRGHEKRIG